MATQVLKQNFRAAVKCHVDVTAAVAGSVHEWRDVTSTLQMVRLYNEIWQTDAEWHVMTINASKSKPEVGSQYIAAVLSKPEVQVYTCLLYTSDAADE